MPRYLAGWGSSPGGRAPSALAPGESLRLQGASLRLHRREPGTRFGRGLRSLGPDGRVLAVRRVCEA
jgi:hypothetical protein